MNREMRSLQLKIVRIGNAFSFYLSQGLEAPSEMRNEGSNLKGRHNGRRERKGEEGFELAGKQREERKGEQEERGGVASR